MCEKENQEGGIGCGNKVSERVCVCVRENYEGGFDCGNDV